jgi:hypothetical protein
MSLRARRRCRISFHAIVGRRDFSATWIEDAERLLFAGSRASLSSPSIVSFDEGRIGKHTHDQQHR